MHLYTEYGSHCGLDHLRVEYIHSVLCGEDRIYTEPVRDTEDGSEIARITDSVKRKVKTSF